MPSSDTELCYLTAGEAVKEFKAKRLSPLELMDAVIARSEQVNPQGSAYTYTFYDRAREQAWAAEKKYLTDTDLRRWKGSRSSPRTVTRSKAKSLLLGRAYSRAYAPATPRRRSNACWRPAQSSTRGLTPRNSHIAASATVRYGA